MAFRGEGLFGVGKVVGHGWDSPISFLDIFPLAIYLRLVANEVSLSCEIKCVGRDAKKPHPLVTNQKDFVQNGS